MGNLDLKRATSTATAISATATSVADTTRYTTKSDTANTHRTYDIWNMVGIISCRFVLGYAIKIPSNINT